MLWVTFWQPFMYRPKMGIVKTRKLSVRPKIILFSKTMQDYGNRSAAICLVMQAVGQAGHSLNSIAKISMGDTSNWHQWAAVRFLPIPTPTKLNYPDFISHEGQQLLKPGSRKKFTGIAETGGCGWLSSVAVAVRSWSRKPVLRRVHCLVLLLN